MWGIGPSPQGYWTSGNQIITMSKLARIISDIQSALATGNVTRGPAVEGLAREYAAECRRIYERLDRCEDFLSKGLISESVYLARTAPDLLDELTLLEFPEKDSWEEVVELYQLPVPPEIPLHKAVSINRAYSDHHLQQDLLGRWRLLNIGKAPLARRLDILRQLCRLDPNNIAYLDNLGELEGERLEDMLQMAREASGKGDPFTLRKLIEELDNSANWSQNPDRAIASEIRTLGQSSQEQAARKEAQAFLRQILDAFRHREESRLQSLWPQFLDKCAQAAVPPGDEMLRVAQPARIWMEESQVRKERKNRRDQAHEQIWSALRDEATTEEELLKYSDFYERNKETFGSMDSGLAQALETRLERFQRKDQARETLIMSIAFVFGALAIVTFLAFIIMRSR